MRHRRQRLRVVIHLAISRVVARCIILKRVTALQLLNYLKSMPRADLRSKEVKLSLAPLDENDLLEIDESDPKYIWLQGYVEPASEN